MKNPYNLLSAFIVHPLLMTSSIKHEIDKLTMFKLMIAEENTWQGIIYGRWPYIKVPPIISSDLIPGIVYYNLIDLAENDCCLLYTSPSPRDGLLSRMPSSA